MLKKSNMEITENAGRVQLTQVNECRMPIYKSMDNPNNSIMKHYLTFLHVMHSEIL